MAQAYIYLGIVLQLFYQETQDLVLTSRALGHSSLLSTKIYIHTTQEHNKKVALVFDSLIENKK
ncbi:hypothetical protein CHC183_08980 [Helicobacter pylori]